MKRFLLIFAAILACVFAVRLCPLLIFPTLLAVLALGGLLVVALGLLALTSPLWIPLLAACGLIALVRRARQA